MCDWSLLLGLREVGREKLEIESVSDIGDCTGDSGNGVSSGDIYAGKGPSSALAGDTGLLPGIVSSFLLVLLL